MTDAQAPPPGPVAVMQATQATWLELPASWPDGRDVAKQLTEMLASRYSGQPTQRDVDVAKVAYAAGAADADDHKQCQDDWDQLHKHLRNQFPPCPDCGCRTSDDADSRDCGCDAGCNDGEWPPGVNVLLLKARAGEREACARLAEQHAYPGSAAFWPSEHETLRKFAELIRARTTP